LITELERKLAEDPDCQTALRLRNRFVSLALAASEP
jgi:hypothetical protein